MTTAREYLRVSKDTRGKLKSPADQHRDHERDAKARRVQLLEPYAEAGARSASKYATKPRDEFTALLGDLKSGRFGADELWIWTASRGSRQLSEWLPLIDLLEQRQVGLWVSSHQRLYDLGNWRDRQNVLDDAVKAEAFSAELSEAVRRGHASLAADGKPTSRTPYGFKRLYDADTGDYADQVPEETEAPVVRELFERLERGWSISGLEELFAESGYRTRAGIPFSRATLRSMTTNPAYGGWRSHNGELFEAAWQPLVPRERWLAVQRTLTAPGRRTTRPGKARHLLSHIAFGTCGHPLGAKPARKSYVCPKGCVRIDQAQLDSYATRVVFGYLARGDNRTVLLAASADGSQLEAARLALAELDRELDQLYADVRAGAVSRRMAAADEQRLTAAKSQAESHLRELSTPSALAGLLGDQPLTTWPESMPVSARREAVRLLFSPGVIGRLRVAKAAYRRQPAHERVSFDQETQ